MPGIVPLGRVEPISYHRVPYSHEVNAEKLINLRQPLYSKAFPSLEDHFERAVKWDNNSTKIDKNSKKLKGEIMMSYTKLTPVKSVLQ